MKKLAMIALFGILFTAGINAANAQSWPPVRLNINVGGYYPGAYGYPVYPAYPAYGYQNYGYQNNGYNNYSGNCYQNNGYYGGHHGGDFRGHGGGRGWGGNRGWR